MKFLNDFTGVNGTLSGTLTVATITLTNPLTQAKTHASPDTDSAPTALHHTLGTGANQAAAGNHSHDASGITSGQVPIARGGTNGSASPLAGAVAYGTGSAYAFTNAGAVGQVLKSNGSAPPTWQDEAAGGGSSNLVVSATDPVLTQPGLWIETDANGDITFWIEDGN